MALDASIFNALGRGVKSVQDYDNEAMQAQSNALGIQNQRMNLLGAQQKQQEYTRSLAEQERVRNALQMLPPGATPEQRIGAYRGSGTMFGYSQADTLEKALVEQRKGNAAAGKDEAQTAAEKFKLRIGHSEQAIKDIAALQSPQDALAGIDRHLANGDIDEAKADMLRRTVPQDPGQFPQWQLGMLRQIMSAADQIKTQAEAEKQAELARHNKSTEGLTQRGQDVTSQTAAAGRAQAERHFQAGQNAPQYMQTDAGLVALPKKVAPGQQPTATVITGPGGESLGKPLKDIPASVNTGIITNTQNLARVNQALELLGGGKVGELTGDKNATGLKGYLPQGLLNRTDSGGIDTRAMIADLGSMVLHDRSGAAVTASESPRLMPFIPLITDSPATAKKKLVRFKQIYEQETQAMNDTYSKGQGYKPNPVSAGAVSPTKTESGATASNW